MSDFQGFANRLRKNFKHWSKWARRREIDCYRLYEKEMPDFPLAIDMYGPRLHVQEYATRWQAGEQEYEQWREQTLSCIAQTLERPAGEIAYKQRKRQKGTQQYEKQEAAAKPFVVQEGGLNFEVDLDSYLDTGLFLDHRITRDRVRTRAAGKRFLNLFAYTGSFSVYAAAGGAASTVTVDLSNTYQEWTRRNFRLNGMDRALNHLERVDVFHFLRRAGIERRQFDLIVMDPPTFSNSKRMQDILDVQRDHVQLILGCMRILAPGGELFFSTNLRGFAMDESALGAYAIEDISRETVPEDFRDKRIHQCFVVRAR